MYIIHLFGQYYLRSNETNWDEIHDPHLATSFKTKKEANDWVKRNTNFLEFAVPVVASEAIAKYDEWMKTGGIRRTFDLMDNSLSRPYDNESAEEVLKWRMTIDPDGIRYDDYKTWPDLSDKFVNLFRAEEFHNNEYTETYRSVSLYFNKKDKYETFKKELDLVLPYVTRIEEGYKVFSVFDRFLSAGGNSVSFLYKSDTDCKVAGRWQSVQVGTLKECFDYLVKERFYDELGDEINE